MHSSPLRPTWERTSYLYAGLFVCAAWTGCGEHRGRSRDGGGLETEASAVFEPPEDEIVTVEVGDGGSQRGLDEPAELEMDGGSSDAALPQAIADAHVPSGADAASEDAAPATDAGVSGDAGPDTALDASADASSDAAPDAAVPSRCDEPQLDLLFMIDNSGSMAEEQRKLAAALPNMIRVLTTGQRDPANPKPTPDFPPIKSMHIGVVSSDMGVNGAPEEDSCGAKSYLPTERDPNSTTVTRPNRPRGDDGIMNTSVAVAVAGIWGRPWGVSPGSPVVEMVPPDLECGAPKYAFPAGQRFIAYDANVSRAEDVAKQFSCIAKLGKNGCGFEQQLEAMLKALTPENSSIEFTSHATNPRAPSRGQAGPRASSAPNAGFLRDDAILTVVAVSDEEDCSIPDSSADLFNRNSTLYAGEDLNIRCGKHPEMQHPISRYVTGLRALKNSNDMDRLIFAGIVGVPVKTGSNTVYSGASELSTLLDAPDMQFRTTGARNDQVVSSCQSADGVAYPARRFVTLAREFGDNGVVTSICDNEYTSVLDSVIAKIALQITRCNSGS